MSDAPGLTLPPSLQDVEHVKIASARRRSSPTKHTALAARKAPTCAAWPRAG